MEIEEVELKSQDKNINNHKKILQQSRNTVCIKGCLLLSVFFTMFFAIGFPFNMSVMYVELLREFGQSNSKTSFVQSVCTGVLFIAGFPSGLMISKFGTKKIGIAAGFLISISLILSYFATSVDYLIITIGLVTGIGASAAHIAGPTCIGHWFEGKSRHIALSFISLGSGIAGILQPLLLNALVREFGLRGTFLLLGGMMLNIIPFAGLWGNSSYSNNPNKNKHKRKVKLQSCDTKTIDKEEADIEVYVDVTGTNTQTESIDDSRYNNGISVEMDHNKDNDVTRKTSLQGDQTFQYKTTRTRYVIFTVLRNLLGNRAYSLHLCALSLAISALNSTNIVMIDFLEFKRFTRNEAVELYMYMGVSFAISTVIVPIGKNIPGASVIMFPIVYTVVAAAAVFNLPNAVTYLQHALVISCYGFGLGGLVVMLYVGTQKIIGLQNYANGLGLVTTSIGICTVIAGPVAGGLFDATGSYDLTFYAAGASIFVSNVVFIGVLILRKLPRKSSSESH